MKINAIMSCTRRSIRCIIGLLDLALCQIGAIFVSLNVTWCPLYFQLSIFSWQSMFLGYGRTYIYRKYKTIQRNSIFTEQYVVPFLHHLASSGAYCTSGSYFFFIKFELTKDYGLYWRKKIWQESILSIWVPPPSRWQIVAEDEKNRTILNGLYLLKYCSQRVIHGLDGFYFVQATTFVA